MKDRIINVLIADQHPNDRSAYKGAIQKIYPNAVFHASEDGASALLALNKNKIHLAIIDENIPILRGMKVIKNCMKLDSFQTKFMLTSSKHNFKNYKKGTKLGVNVFIDKAQAKKEIKYGIKAIQNDTKFLCDCLKKEISIINGFSEKVASLTPNERLFLDELKDGKSIREISDKLVISNKSVNMITSKICHIFEIPADQTMLAAWAKNHKHYFK